MYVVRVQFNMAVVDGYPQVESVQSSRTCITRECVILFPGSFDLLLQSMSRERLGDRTYH